jgi:SAM-dependent methyltransferase
MPDLPDYALTNRAAWTDANAKYYDAKAEESWASPTVTWGVWGAPEESVKALPDVNGKDLIELGCGTAYVAAWMKRRGARRVVGVDITPAQLETARRLNSETGLGLELLEANAEAVPLPGATFDVAISEYGASIWCDPYKWIPEAARLLRARGELIFLCNSPLVMLCSPSQGKVEERLQRPQRGLHRLEWEDEPGVEFHLGHGEMFQLLRKSGFEVTDLIELYAADSTVDHPYYSNVPAAWAKRWPAEDVWRARKR